MGAQLLWSHRVITLQNYEHLSHWYHPLEEIKKYEFEVASSGIMFILNFMKICSAILELCVQMDITGDDVIAEDHV
jgi:hypothetical protein